MKLIGLALANGIIACLPERCWRSISPLRTSSSSTGKMVLGLASIIVGEAFFGHRTILRGMLSVVAGSLIYRFLLTFALQFGMSASDLNLFSALLVALAISLPYIKKRRNAHMLDLNDICMTFHPGTVNERRALDHVSLHLNDGEFRLCARQQRRR